tara:strand:+ start:5585 stop:6115 length:531 start_codon:yes stop_codon:yes gene_type:complete
MDNNDDEQQLRSEARRHAPRPSALHDEAILRAARNKAGQKKVQRPQRRWLMVGAGLAASLFLAVGVLQISSTIVPDTDRSGRGTDAAAWPSENIELASPPTEFRWSEQADGSRYQVRLHNDAAEQLWESEWVSTPHISIDDSTVELLARGKRYFWVVNVEGNVTNQSMGPYWFRIK